MRKVLANRLWGILGSERGFVKQGLGSERGMALLVAILITAVLVSLTGVGLVVSGINLKTAGSLNTGNGAFQVADAGIQHALAAIPSGSEFDSFLAGTSLGGFSCTSPCDGTNKPTLTASLSDYTYTVVAEDDADGGSGNNALDDTNSFVLLTSTATGPNGAKRKIKAYVARSVWVPAGAVYIPGQPEFMETAFNGGDFRISGYDTAPGGLPGSGPARPIPAISTTDPLTTAEISAPLLSSTQYTQLTGIGGSPSVLTSSASARIDVAQLADNLISVGVEGFDKQTKSGGSYSGENVWGSSLLPKITHITGDAQLSGNLTGWGVLIVDGNLNTRGNFTFSGLIIVRGDASIHGAGNSDELATVYGALLSKGSVTSDSGIEFEIGGRGKIYFSSQAIAKVTSAWSLPFNGLPTPARLVGWQDVME